MTAAKIARRLPAFVLFAASLGSTCPGGIDETMLEEDRSLVSRDSSVSGLVIDELTDLGVADATVTAGTESTTSDARGFFFLSGLRPGANDLAVNADGYTDLVETVWLEEGGNAVAPLILSTICDGVVCPDVLVESATQIAIIALDGSDLYYRVVSSVDDLGNWRYDGLIAKMSTTDNQTTELAAGEWLVDVATANETTLFWTGVNHAIRSVPKTGGEVTTVVQGEGVWRSSLGATATDIYWNDMRVDTDLMRAPIDGSAAPEVYLTQTELAAVQGHAIYSLQRGSQESVLVRTSILDPASQVIDRTGYVPQGIVEEDGRVYVLTTVTDFVALYRATLDGSEPKLVLMNDGTDVPSCLAVNATHVIWTKSIPGTNEFAIYAWPKGASAGDEVLVGKGEGSCKSASASKDTLFLSRGTGQGDYYALEAYALSAAE